MAKGHGVRLTSSIVVVALLVAGTFWGDDDNFPFGPFRMYSTKQGLDGEVRAMAVEGLTTEGVWVEVPFEDFGLRRADVEGQLGRFERPPLELLDQMESAYLRFHQADEGFRALRLREHTFDIEDGLEAGETIETVATLRMR